MHFSSILWEEQLRNKGLQNELACLLCFLYYFTFYSPFVSHCTTPYSPSGCPSLWPMHRFIRRHVSKKTTWCFLLALPWPPRGTERLNSGLFYFSSGLGSHREGEKEKRRKGLNVVAGAEAGMCLLYLCPFVGHDG